MTSFEAAMEYVCTESSKVSCVCKYKMYMWIYVFSLEIMLRYGCLISYLHFCFMVSEFVFRYP